MAVRDEKIDPPKPLPTLAELDRLYDEFGGGVHPPRRHFPTEGSDSEYVASFNERVATTGISTATYERRLFITILGRGMAAAYILGIILSLGRLDPRDWQAFAGICSVSFLIGWIVMMNMERE